MILFSGQYIAFLCLIIILYFATPYHRRWFVLLVASYLFYASWRLSYIVILLASTTVDYYCARKMSSLPNEQKRRPYLALSLIFNLNLLAYFKYTPWLYDTLNSALHLSGLEYAFLAPDFIFPLGISFYTLQTIGYTIDVYKGRLQAEDHLGRFALYVAFFPQLTAGPIERGKNLLPQLHCRFDFDYDRIVSGLRLIMWGFFKKFVVADRLVLPIATVYGASYQDYQGIHYFIASCLFLFQIYWDFSGYTDIARGSGRIMGIRLSENFKRPLFARTMQQLWSRWHISLTNWLRDYVFKLLPIKKGRHLRSQLALRGLLIFLLIGLWHGNTINFVLWGTLHGIYYVAEVTLRHPFRRLAQITNYFLHSSVTALLQNGWTLLLFILFGVFFRAPDLDVALHMLRKILAVETLVTIAELPQVISEMFVNPFDIWVSCLGIGTLLLAELLQEFGGKRGHFASYPVWGRWLCYNALIMAIILLKPDEPIQFVYFNY